MRTIASLAVALVLIGVAFVDQSNSLAIRGKIQEHANLLARSREDNEENSAEESQGRLGNDEEEQ